MRLGTDLAGPHPTAGHFPGPWPPCHIRLSGLHLDRQVPLQSGGSAGPGPPSGGSGPPGRGSQMGVFWCPGTPHFGGSGRGYFEGPGPPLETPLGGGPGPPILGVRGAPRPGGPGGAPGTPGCTFSRVFNNSPSRDRCCLFGDKCPVSGGQISAPRAPARGVPGPPPGGSPDPPSGGVQNGGFLTPPETPKMGHF